MHGPTLEGLDRYFDRVDAQAAARAHVCPTCMTPPDIRCVDSHGLDTKLVHRARYVQAGIDPAVDVYAMDDDKLRGVVLGMRAIAAARWCDRLYVNGRIGDRDALLATIPVEYRNGREVTR